MREPKVMGRPREFDETEALARIMDVFWAKGFEGASMSDLVAATGLKKGSLYAAFGDKRAMYLKALALYDRLAIDRSVKTLVGPGSPVERLAAFFQAAIDPVAARKDRRGCFLCNAAVDQAVPDAQTRRAVTRSLARLGRALEKVLAALADTSIDGGRHYAEAQHLLSVYFGLRVMAKGGHTVRALIAAKDAAIRRHLPEASVTD